MKRIAWLIGMVGLSACLMEDGQSTQGESHLTKGPEAIRKLERVCVQEGGTMVHGIAGPQCARPEPDANMACEQDSDCSGFCLAETKTCSPLTPFFGCHEVLPSVGKPAVICID